MVKSIGVKNNKPTPGLSNNPSSCVRYNPRFSRKDNEL